MCRCRCSCSVVGVAKPLAKQRRVIMRLFILILHCYTPIDFISEPPPEHKIPCLHGTLMLSYLIYLICLWSTRFRPAGAHDAGRLPCHAIHQTFGEWSRSHTLHAVGGSRSSFSLDGGGESRPLRGRERGGKSCCESTLSRSQRERPLRMFGRRSPALRVRLETRTEGRGRGTKVTLKRHRSAFFGGKRWCPRSGSSRPFI
ncbi:unnamed protein product [Ascophyllum nodosum]